jgi:hypothetical protein
MPAARRMVWLDVVKSAVGTRQGPACVHPVPDPDVEAYASAVDWLNDPMSHGALGTDGQQAVIRIGSADELLAAVSRSPL